MLLLVVAEICLPQDSPFYHHSHLCLRFTTKCNMQIRIKELKADKECHDSASTTAKESADKLKKRFKRLSSLFKEERW